VDFLHALAERDPPLDLFRIEFTKQISTWVVREINALQSYLRNARRLRGFSLVVNTGSNIQQLVENTVPASEMYMRRQPWSDNRERTPGLAEAIGASHIERVHFEGFRGIEYRWLQWCQAFQSAPKLKSVSLHACFVTSPHIYAMVASTTTTTTTTTSTGSDDRAVAKQSIRYPRRLAYLSLSTPMKTWSKDCSPASSSSSSTGTIAPTDHLVVLSYVTGLRLRTVVAACARPLPRILELSIDGPQDLDLDTLASLAPQVEELRLHILQGFHSFNMFGDSRIVLKSLKFFVRDFRDFTTYQNAWQAYSFSKNIQSLHLFCVKPSTNAVVRVHTVL
jgi:hypothetical protein